MKVKVEDIGQYATPEPPAYKRMRLRDYFAAQALAGMNASLTNAADWPADDGCALMARSAYLQADAMLKAREVKS